MIAGVTANRAARTLAALDGCVGGGPRAIRAGILVLLTALSVTVLGPPPARASAPTITSVSPISPTATQSIEIGGSGFGTHEPYNGDSYYLQISDLTKGWNAGWCDPSLNPPGDPNSCVPLASPSDAVALAVGSWSDTDIRISGFTGAYGQNGWTLDAGDQVEVDVWNAPTGTGPAVYMTTVTSAPAPGPVPMPTPTPTPMPATQVVHAAKHPLPGLVASIPKPLDNPVSDAVASCVASVLHTKEVEAALAAVQLTPATAVLLKVLKYTQKAADGTDNVVSTVLIVDDLRRSDVLGDQKLLPLFLDSVDLVPGAACATLLVDSLSGGGYSLLKQCAHDQGCNDEIFKQATGLDPAELRKWGLTSEQEAELSKGLKGAKVDIPVFSVQPATGTGFVTGSVALHSHRAHRMRAGLRRGWNIIQVRVGKAFRAGRHLLTIGVRRGHRRVVFRRVLRVASRVGGRRRAVAGP